MTDSERLRAMARYIRDHGFSRHEGKDGRCRCFYGAERSTAAGHWVDSTTSVAWKYVAPIVGDLMPWSLKANGWTNRKVTDDAAAACEIAADLCEPSP